MQDFELLKSLKNGRIKNFAGEIRQIWDMDMEQKESLKYYRTTFFIKFNVSKINKFSFLVKCNPAVSLQL